MIDTFYREIENPDIGLGLVTTADIRALWDVLAVYQAGRRVEREEPARTHLAPS